MTDTPASYRGTGECDPSKAYWLSNVLALIGDSNFGLYEDQENLFEENTVAACRHLQHETDAQATAQSDLPAYLTAVNEKMAAIAMANSNKLLGQMLALGEPQMKLQFTLHD